MDGHWATRSEGVGLVVRAISFQDFQPVWSCPVVIHQGHAVLQTDGQTEGRHMRSKYRAIRAVTMN